MTPVYNVVSFGFSVGLTRSMVEAEEWRRKAIDPKAFISHTGLVARWEAPEATKQAATNISPLLCSGKLPTRPKAVAEDKTAKYAKVGAPHRKAAKKLSRRRNDYAKTMASKPKYTCPGSLQRG
jgi:hypothetical protein